MRKYLLQFLGVLGIVVAIALLVIGLRHFRVYWQMTHFICSYPDFDDLWNGMTTTEIKEILGEPWKQVRVDDEAQNFYGSPWFEPEATQCWLYEFNGWNGRIWVYFDKEGRVVAKGCGTG